jgi:hypothetical protein
VVVAAELRGGQTSSIVEEGWQWTSGGWWRGGRGTASITGQPVGVDGTGCWLRNELEGELDRDENNWTHDAPHVVVRPLLKTHIMKNVICVLVFYV